MDAEIRASYEHTMHERLPYAILPIESTFLGFLNAVFEPQASDGSMRCSVPVGDHLKQPMGIIHGGVYASISESIASMGSALLVGVDRGLAVMGQSNNTTFLRPVTDGTIHAVASVRHKGRTSMVWQVDMTNDDGKLCAMSQVTIAIRPMPTSQ